MRKRRPIGRDAGVPGRHTGGQGHQTLDLQGALDGLSRGHKAHDAIHGGRLPRKARPLPHLPKGFGKIGKPLRNPEGGGPR